VHLLPRQHDNDQYLCSFFLPKDARAGVHIIRAFNLEIAQVESRHSIPTIGGGGLHAQQEVFGDNAKSAQSELPTNEILLSPHEPSESEENQQRVGLMKLHWWRDGVENALENVGRLQHLEYTIPPESLDKDESALSIAAHAQPVLNMIAIACTQYRLTTRWISRIIDARVRHMHKYHRHPHINTAHLYTHALILLLCVCTQERSLSEGQPADINALLAHAESTSSALLYLTLECMGIRNVHADHAASHIGKALGILLTLRSLPYHASKQQIYLPRSIIVSEQVDIASVLSGHNSPQLANAVFELASIAKSHIEHARQLAPQIPKEATPALLPAVLCERFLTRLEEHHFDLFAPGLGLLPTAPKDSTDTKRDASISGITLSGSNQGIQPLLLRIALLRHAWSGTY
jgi:phytoene/squalene synthetase